ncbi:MAG: DUF1559 domain-containing protein, partial [Planctomycetota bacterium]
MQCVNNLKQLSLGMHNLASAKRAFPSLSFVNDNYDPGYSFWIELLPYIELNNFYDGLDLEAHPWLAHASAVANKQFVDGKQFPEFVCPSSTHPLFANVERHTPGNEFPDDAMSTRPQYISVSGAVADDPNAPQPRFDEPENSRCCNCCGGNASTGIFSPRGILAPAESRSKLSAVKDGLSKTLLFAEASAPYFDFQGEPLQVYGRSGIIMGSDRPENRFGTRYFHATTIRYAINTDSRELPGVAPNWGANLPLTSMHPGGVNACSGDGAVFFLNDGMDMIVLKRLATKDDGGIANVIE